MIIFATTNPSKKNNLLQVDGYAKLNTICWTKLLTAVLLTGTSMKNRKKLALIIVRMHLSRETFVPFPNDI